MKKTKREIRGNSLKKADNPDVYIPSKDILPSDILSRIFENAKKIKEKRVGKRRLEEEKKRAERIKYGMD